MHDTHSSCCPWMKGFLKFAFVGLIGAAGYVLGSRQTEPEYRLPPELLNASAAVSSDEFSVATGNVSGDSEGYFVLDHATGRLQCYVLYPRTGKFGGVFATNVGDAMAGRGEKGSKYVMVTGSANFPGGGRNGAPAGTVIYVLNTTSGAFVAYGLMFDRTMLTAGRPQTGTFIPLDAGQARQLAVRE